MAKETKSTSPAVVAAAVFIILAGLSYSGYTYYRYTAGIPPERGGEFGPGFGEGPPPGVRGPGGREGRPDFDQMRREMAEELQLTPEQQAQIQELMQARRAEWGQRGPGGPGGPGGPFEAMRSILTPEQQAKAQQMMGDRMERRIQRRLEEAKKSLPSKDLPAYEKRLREQAERFRNMRRGGRGGPRPGGPPPSGGGAPPSS